jgi:hypothetical protein
MYPVKCGEPTPEKYFRPRGNQRINHSVVIAIHTLKEMFEIIQHDNIEGFAQWFEKCRILLICRNVYNSTHGHFLGRILDNTRSIVTSYRVLEVTTTDMIGIVVAIGIAFGTRSFSSNT